MDKSYIYDPSVKIESGGYAGEEHGVYPSDIPPTTTTELTGSAEHQYFYRDSTIPSNANSSRVLLTIKESWTVSFDNANNMIVQVTASIPSIVRDDLRPGAGQVTAGLRNIYIRETLYGANRYTISNDSIATAHTMATGINLGTYSFVIPAGGSNGRGTVAIFNCVPGHESDPLPSQDVDALYAGVFFTNPLPADYRPGESWNGSAFMSHNRNGGVCNIWNGSNWVEMRTANPDGNDNPPLTFRDNAWHNQKLIGQE